MGKETSEATRRMVRLAHGNLCGIQLFKGLAGQPMDVSLDQKAITAGTKQGALTQLISNNV